jgi:signal transduction histidine kinase
MRLRIAQDLHDEVGSNLGTILVLSKMLQSGGGNEFEDREDTQRIQSVAQETARIVRDIAWFTNPTFDSTSGLHDRMESAAAETLAGIEVNFRAPSARTPSRRLSLEFRRNVFAIFKECLHNIVKHSQAGHVEINIDDQGQVWSLQIKDNGVGFDPKSATQGNGLGNLQRRAAELGGTLEIKSTPGNGTTIQLSVAKSLMQE